MLEYHNRSTISLGGIATLYDCARKEGRQQSPRGPSGWNIFMRQEIATIPHYVFGEASTAISNKWKALSQGERQKYGEKAKLEGKITKVARRLPISKVRDRLQGEMAKLESSGRHALYMVVDDRLELCMGGTSLGFKYIADLEGIGVGGDHFVDSVSGHLTRDRVASIRSLLKTYSAHLLPDPLLPEDPEPSFVTSDLPDTAVISNPSLANSGNEESSRSQPPLRPGLSLKNAKYPPSAGLQRLSRDAVAKKLREEIRKQFCNALHGSSKFAQRVTSGWESHERVYNLKFITPPGYSLQSFEKACRRPSKALAIKLLGYIEEGAFAIDRQ
ncbi:hypothetical protein TWF694_005205 [Orbilia ellipsospora]